MNPESGIFQALSLAADLVIVNVLMVLTSIPIVTIGASLRAGNYVIAQMVAESGSHPARTYFRAFASQIKVVTAWWLVVLLVISLFTVEWLVLDNMDIAPNTDFAFRTGLLSGVLIVAGISLWLFYEEALSARSFSTAFVEAAMLSLRHLPRTFLGLAMLALPMIFFILAPERWVALLSFYLIIGFALTLYLFQLLVRGVLSA